MNIKKIFSGACFVVAFNFVCLNAGESYTKESEKIDYTITILDGLDFSPFLNPEQIKFFKNNFILLRLDMKNKTNQPLKMNKSQPLKECNLFVNYVWLGDIHKSMHPTFKEMRNCMFVVSFLLLSGFLIDLAFCSETYYSILLSFAASFLIALCLDFRSSYSDNRFRGTLIEKIPDNKLFIDTQERDFIILPGQVVSDLIIVRRCDKFEDKLLKCGFNVIS